MMTRVQASIATVPDSFTHTSKSSAALTAVASIRLAAASDDASQENRAKLASPRGRSVENRHATVGQGNGGFKQSRRGAPTTAGAVKGRASPGAVPAVPSAG